VTSDIAVEELDSTDDAYGLLLREMPAIAEAVNAFRAEAVQLEAFRALLAAFRGRRNETRDIQLSRAERKWNTAHRHEISRRHPTLFVFLLDQSRSMVEPLGVNGPERRRKMDELASAVNSWLHNMVIRLTGPGGIKHYVDVAMMGYRTDPAANPIIESPLGGELGERARQEDRMLCAITEIGENPARIDQHTRSFLDEETGELVETTQRVPVWVEPKAEGGSPMCSALRLAHDIVHRWIGEHRDSFPPVVINVTDGGSQDGDPIPYANALRDLATDNGNVLLFNCHLSISHQDTPLFLPGDEGLPCPEARMLHRMSSPLPKRMYDYAVNEGFKLQPGAKGMAFNADMATLTMFLDTIASISEYFR
jgi:hypothetical protein